MKAMLKNTVSAILAGAVLGIGAMSVETLRTVWEMKVEVSALKVQVAQLAGQKTLAEK